MSLKPESNPKLINTTQIQELFTRCVSILKEANIPNYKQEVEFIFSDIMKCSIPDVYLNQKAALPGEAAKKIEAIIKQRLTRIPLGYLLSRLEFFNVDLHVDTGVYLPRPETELIVDEVLKAINPGSESRNSSIRIIELGTGSGAIACALAKTLSKASIWATDISGAAIRNAKQNAIQNKVENKINFLQGDWFEPLQQEDLENQIEVVVSNPPYIRSKDIPGLAPEVKNHDPLIAMDGGDDGLACIRKLIENTPAFLKEGGSLILEIGYNQSEPVRKLAQSTGMYRNMRFIKDYNGIDRVFVAIKK